MSKVDALARESSLYRSIRESMGRIFDEKMANGNRQNQPTEAGREYVAGIIAYVQNEGSIMEKTGGRKGALVDFMA
jgi:hypothetical protein